MRAPPAFVSLVAAVATLVVLAAPAGAASAASSSSSSGSVVLYGSPGAAVPVAEVTIPMTIRGRLAVGFQGDPGGDCAGSSSCGYRGAITWDPGPGGEIDILESRSSRGHLSYEITLSLLDIFANGPLVTGTTHAQVSWTPPPSASGSQATRCADAVTSAGSAGILAPRRGQVALSPLEVLPGPLETRCAGPLGVDLSSALPPASVPIARLLHGRTRLDFSHNGGFAAGGFAGSVDSTLVLSLGRPRRTALFVRRRPRHLQSQHVVELDFRARLSGTDAVNYVGATPASACAPLGACGLRGTSQLRTEVQTSATVSITGSSRLSYRELLAGVGIGHGNPRGMTLGGLASFAGGTSLLNQVKDGELTQCADSASGIGGVLLLNARHGQLAVAYVPGAEFGDGMPRTRCPGPLLGQDSNQATAVGQVPLRDLAHRRLTVRLYRGARLSGDGYTAASAPRLTLTLTRTHLRRLTQQVGTFFSSARRSSWWESGMRSRPRT